MQDRDVKKNGLKNCFIERLLVAKYTYDMFQKLTFYGFRFTKFIFVNIKLLYLVKFERF